jgi:hypothetical protein
VREHNILRKEWLSKTPLVDELKRDVLADDVAVVNKEEDFLAQCLSTPPSFVCQKCRVRGDNEVLLWKGEEGRDSRQARTAP